MYKRDKDFCSKAGKIGGRRAEESRRRNSPYIWKGVNFVSRQEREVAKILLKEPIAGVNCHIRVGSKTIDFFPQEGDKMFQGLFVEYHPWDRRVTTEEYKKQREEAVENSEYKGTELVVIDREDFITRNQI